MMSKGRCVSSWVFLVTGFLVWTWPTTGQKWDERCPLLSQMYCIEIDFEYMRRDPSAEPTSLMRTDDEIANARGPICQGQENVCEPASSQSGRVLYVLALAPSG